MGVEDIVNWNSGSKMQPGKIRQEQLQQQERLAAVGQLTAGIAHDFNNILTVIIGLAELVREHPDLPKVAAQDMDCIVKQGRRAARLVRQILDFSRRTIPEKRPLDLVPFISELIKLLERTLPENIQLILEVEPGEYILEADPAQLQQALTNLAVNARDAMPEGGVLRFRLTRLNFGSGSDLPCPGMLPGHWIALSVSDTGMGIPAEIRAHLFEPFFTTKKVGQGTGLGLAQVYSIIKQHGGEIDVDSHIGHGTTFRLYLPATSSIPPPASSAQREIPLGHGELVLLVEDNPPVLEVTQAMLERLRYRVLIATSGQYALELYDQYKEGIALVLADITMPGLSGVALFQTLREQNPGVKVVVMTGYPLSDGEVKNLLAQGVTGQLQKPLNIEQLAQQISQFLRVDYTNAT